MDFKKTGAVLEHPAAVQTTGFRPRKPARAIGRFFHPCSDCGRFVVVVAERGHSVFAAPVLLFNTVLFSTSTIHNSHGRGIKYSAERWS